MPRINEYIVRPGRTLHAYDIHINNMPPQNKGPNPEMTRETSARANNVQEGVTGLKALGVCGWGMWV